LNTEDTPLYNGIPLEFSTDPVYIKKSDSIFIEETLTHLLSVAEEFTKQALKDPDLLIQLGLPPDLPDEPTPLGFHIPFARFDFLFDSLGTTNESKLKVLELNTDGTSGFNTSEWIGEKANIPDEENPNKDLSKRLYNAILAHSPKSPEVVLLDLENTETNWEQRDLVKRWNVFGSAKWCDPISKNWSPGSVIYRRILSWQLRYHQERFNSFLNDWSEKKITVVGGWSSDVGMSKVWPAITKSTEFPETRVLNKFLIHRLRDEREKWILKGALSYAGKAVLRGSDLSQEKWESTLTRILSETESGRPWIAQEKCPIPLVDGKPCELGLYFLNGVASGYMCRWGHLDPISEKSTEILRPVQIIP